eukprot:762834-Hanusia_phi.AAC.2
MPRRLDLSELLPRIHAYHRRRNTCGPLRHKNWRRGGDGKGERKVKERKRRGLERGEEKNRKRRGEENRKRRGGERKGRGED